MNIQNPMLNPNQTRSNDEGGQEQQASNEDMLMYLDSTDNSERPRMYWTKPKTKPNDEVRQRQERRHLDLS
jgi:hypothetical protein